VFKIPYLGGSELFYKGKSEVLRKSSFWGGVEKLCFEGRDIAQKVNYD
jgi:hypothetical protein